MCWELGGTGSVTPWATTTLRVSSSAPGPKPGDAEANGRLVGGGRVGGGGGGINVGAGGRGRWRLHPHLPLQVFQRREDGSVNFFRGWEAYRDGFGKLTGEHWLGEGPWGPQGRSAVPVSS